VFIESVFFILDRVSCRRIWLSLKSPCLCVFSLLRVDIVIFDVKV